MIKNMLLLIAINFLKHKLKAFSILPVIFADAGKPTLPDIVLPDPNAKNINELISKKGNLTSQNMLTEKSYVAVF
jgi:hypothetical protein